MSNQATNHCTQCGAPLAVNVSACRYCGTAVSAPAPAPPAQQPPTYQQPPGYAPPPYYPPPYHPSMNPKSKIAAALLAIFLGGLGIHKFYLGRAGMGILYLLFFWTAIPAFVGFVEGIIYLCTSDENFYYRYVKK